MTTGETIALIIRTFVRKVISLLSNMLSSFVAAFLPKSKLLLILWLQSQSTVILEPKNIKSITVSIFSLSIFHEIMGQMSWSYFFEYWVLSQLFHSPLSPSSGGSYFLFISCHESGIICTTKVLDISLSNLDSRLSFILPGSPVHNYYCYLIQEHFHHLFPKLCIP